MFPQRGKKFINQPFGQVWYAIAADNPILAATSFQRIIFDRGAMAVVSGTQPRRGESLYCGLAKGQLINSSANPRTALIYSPTGKTTTRRLKIALGQETCQNKAYTNLSSSRQHQRISTHIIADNLTSAPQPTQLHLTPLTLTYRGSALACTRNSINRNLLANLDGGNAGKFGSVEHNAPEREFWNFIFTKNATSSVSILADGEPLTSSH